MGSIRLQRKVVRWGHAYGIRVTKAEMGRLGLRENDTATVDVRAEPQPVDLGHLTLLRLGRNAAENHDDIIGAGLDDARR